MAGLILYYGPFIKCGCTLCIQYKRWQGPGTHAKGPLRFSYKASFCPADALPDCAWHISSSNISPKLTIDSQKMSCVCVCGGGGGGGGASPTFL